MSRNQYDTYRASSLQSRERIEAAEVEEGNTNELLNNDDRTSPRGLLPTSTPILHARDKAVSSNGKRKLSKTSPQSPSPAKRTHIIGKEGSEKRPGLGTADKYNYLKRSHLQEECLSRSLPVTGSTQDLEDRLKLYDAAQAQIATPQEPVKESVTSYTSSTVEPSDRYTQMSQKDLRNECVKRSLPTGLAKKDLRHCLRLYDAARALGLTPEESLEAQKAIFQHPIEHHTRVVSPPLRQTEGNNSGAASEEAVEAPVGAGSHGPRSYVQIRPSESHDLLHPLVEGRALRDVSQKSAVESAMSLDSQEDGPSSSANSQASSKMEIASSSATTQDSIQDRGTSDIGLGPAATPDYAAMGYLELRSLCRSRSLKQHGFTASQLRKALIAYDRSFCEQAKNIRVGVDPDHRTEELEVDDSVSPPPLAFVNLESSSQDRKASAQRMQCPVMMHKEPLPGDLLTVNQSQCLLASTDAQEETRQGRLVEKVSARTSSEKGSNIPSYDSQSVSNDSKATGIESSSWKTPYTQNAMLLQQPLISLLNLMINDAMNDSSERPHQGIEVMTKPLSEHAINVAEKEDFNARYATESPYWICCCGIPSYEVAKKQQAKISGNCIYHVSQLAQRWRYTMKEYEEYLVTQQALDRTESCLCQKPAVNYPEHRVTITRGGFILAQVWREQLIRRYSLTTFRSDLAVAQRKGILEVLHNILEDFMIELSSRGKNRPLVLWARIEAMAWFISTLPMSNEWHSFQDWRRPRHYIMLFGIALLSAIDALLRKNLFKNNEPQVPNLGLVLALFIQATWDSPSSTLDLSDGKDAYRSPFNNDICANNENGWAAEIISLTEQHGISMNGVKSIDRVVDQWRKRKESFDLIRDLARKKQYATSHKEHKDEMIPPSDAKMASSAAKEGETPASRGTGSRVTVRAFQTLF